MAGSRGVLCRVMCGQIGFQLIPGLLSVRAASDLQLQAALGSKEKISSKGKCSLRSVYTHPLTAYRM